MRNRLSMDGLKLQTAAKKPVSNVECESQNWHEKVAVWNANLLEKTGVILFVGEIHMQKKRVKISFVTGFERWPAQEHVGPSRRRRAADSSFRMPSLRNDGSWKRGKRIRIVLGHQEKTKWLSVSFWTFRFTENKKCARDFGLALRFLNTKAQKCALPASFCWLNTTFCPAPLSYIQPVNTFSMLNELFWALRVYINIHRLLSHRRRRPFLSFWHVPSLNVKDTNLSKTTHMYCF